MSKIQIGSVSTWQTALGAMALFALQACGTDGAGTDAVAEDVQPPAVIQAAVDGPELTIDADSFLCLGDMTAVFAIAALLMLSTSSAATVLVVT